MAKTINRFMALKAEAEKLLNRRVTNREIRKATGVAESTLADWSKQKVQQYNMEKSVAPVIAYFLALGVDCTIGDFFGEGEDFAPLGIGQKESKVALAQV